MTAIRIWTVCAAFLAGLTLILGTAELTPVVAQSAAEAPLPAQTRPGRPLNLLPHLGKASKSASSTRRPARVAKAKATTRHVAQRRSPTRTYAARQHAPAIASREDEESAATSPGSLGYQAEGTETKAQPPIDDWLRAPLPPAAPAAVRSPVMATRDRVNATAKTGGTETVVSPATVSPDSVAAGTSIAEPAPVDLSDSDTVQVADAGEINEIDLAADAATPSAPATASAPAGRSWLHSFLAIIAGAFAAAATAGFLFGRRRPAEISPIA